MKMLNVGLAVVVVSLAFVLPSFAETHEEDGKGKTERSAPEKPSEDSLATRLLKAMSACTDGRPGSQASPQTPPVASEGQTSPTPSTTPSEGGNDRGKTVFETSCAKCHEVSFLKEKASSLDAALDGTGPKGIMPQDTKKELDKSDKEALKSWLAAAN